jgi:hypothetical protein
LYYWFGQVRGYRMGGLLILALVLAACATTPVPVVVTLTVSPATATVTVGTTTPVAFNATLTNSSDVISWVLTGAGSITASSGASTSYVPPGSGGASSATLTASAAGKTASAVITINEPVVTTVTVSGTVEDLFGQPQPGLAVKIGSSATNTDANGNFSIANVATPYNTIVVDSANSVGYVFEGLTRSDPTLQLFTLSFFTPDNTATINTGNLSGGAGFPNPVSHRTVVAFGSNEGFSPVVVLGAGDGPGYGPTSVNWSGSPTTNGALHALQAVVDGNGIPTDYTGYGMTSLALSNGGTFNSTATDIALSNGVADTSLTGSIALPTGYTLDQTVLYSDFGTNQSLPLLVDGSPSTSFTYTTPNLTGSTITSLVQASEDGGLGISGAFLVGSAPNAAAVALTVPEIPELILPAESAAGVTVSTPFIWQPFPGGIHVALFTVGTIDYVVTTANSQTTIPDLSAEGLSLPAAANGEWLAVGIAPFASMDAASGPGGYGQDFIRALFAPSLLPAPEQGGSFGFTTDRVFTTP